jgi:hypothetical protein
MPKNTNEKVPRERETVIRTFLEHKTFKTGSSLSLPSQDLIGILKNKQQA